jgi:hypothetical protein
MTSQLIMFNSGRDFPEWPNTQRHYSSTCSLRHRLPDGDRGDGVLDSFAKRRGVRLEIPGGHKRCRKCTLVKPVLEFWKEIPSRDGYCSACKMCMTAQAKSNRASMRHRVKTVYGLTLEQYDEMKSLSDECPICGVKESLHLDHDAGSGKIRAFICGRCNRGLGMFSHDPDRLLTAAEYLRGHN